MNWEKEKELLLVGRQVVRKHLHRLAKVKLLQSTCRHWHSWLCRKLGGNRTDFSACKQQCMWERKRRQERVTMQSPYLPVLGIHKPRLFHCLHTGLGLVLLLDVIQILLFWLWPTGILPLFPTILQEKTTVRFEEDEPFHCLPLKKHSKSPFYHSKTSDTEPN